MNKKTLLSWMMLLFAFMGYAQAEEVTVYDGTVTNDYVPAYVYYFDDFTRSQYVIPAADLASMNGGTISSVKFYTNSSNIPYTTVSTVDVYLKEVDYTSISDFEAKASCQVVYTGTLEFVAEGSGGACVITFSTPFTYNGGNLLVGCENTTDADWKHLYFYGQTVNGASVAGYNTYNLNDVPATQRNFIPKTTFTFDPSGDCVRPTQLTATEVGPNLATLSWTENGNSESWYIFYHAETYGTAAPEDESIEVFENPFTLTGLMPFTTYEAYVIPSCGVENDDPNNSLMSSTITFTTLEDCPLPQNVAVSSVTDTEATVSWSDYNDSYELQLGSPSDSIQTLLYESFDNGFSYNWSNDPTYPWTFVDGHLQSGNAGVASSTSSISVFMDFDTFGTVEFDAECMGEGTSTFWDHCDFSIDGEIMLNAGENLNTAGWLHYSYPVTAGQHTFTWSYTKDGSINPTGDYFAIDNVVMGLTEIEWGNSVYVQNPPYTFTGLNPLTDYYVHVRGICGNNAQQPVTAWSEPIHFSTLGYYTVTVSANSADGGTVTGGGVFYSGDTCTVIASPNDYYYFSHWSKNGITVSYDSIYSFAVTENANIVANFNPMGYDFWLIADPEDGGQVEFLDGNDYYAYFGDTITISATSNPNYRFLKWTASGRYGRSGRSEVELSTDSIYNFILDADFLNSVFDNGVSGGDGQEQAYIELTAHFIGGIGDCIQPFEFTTTEVGPTLATFSWTELGNSESWQMYYRPAYTVAYVPYDSLEIFQNPYTLTGLQPNTAYEAYIIPSCGITDGIANSYLASNTVIFTTLEACPTPMNVEVTNITGTSATVTWVGYSDSYQVQLGHPDFAIGAHFTNGIPADWVNSTDYPWTVIDGHMQSSNAGVPNSTSSISVTVTFPADGSIEFDAECMGEGEGASGYCYDHCDFYIDTTRVLYAGNEIEGWNHYFYNVTAGEHTFTWSYTKDGLVDNPGDHFAVDNVVMQAGEIVWDNPISVENAPYTITGMDPTNNYCVRVKGVNADMESGWSTPVFFTTVEAYTITVNASPANAGTVSGGGVFNAGESCTLTATANGGYTFINWTKNGQNVSNNASYTFTVSESATYVANFSRNSYAIMVIANPTEGGTVTGSGTYNHGTPVTLTATPNAGYTFLNWTKNGQVVSSNTTYTFTASGAGTYVANFQQIEYYPWFTVLPENGGSAEIQGDGIVHYGDQVTIIATPNTGYDFVNWTTENFESAQALYLSNQATYTFTMDNSHLLTELYPDGGEIQIFANFELQSFEITVMAEEGGTVTGSSTGTYAYGDTLHLNAVANQGYTFTNWTKNGTVVSNNASCDFPVTETATYIAHFSTNAYQITASTNPTGAGTISGAGEYNYGASCTLTVTPNEGYTFVNWTKDGQLVGTSTSITFTVTGDADYVANFITNTYEITASTNPTGAGTVTGAGEYNYGASCTLTVTPNEGYTFVNWTKDGQVVGTSTSITFTVTGDADYVANFNTNSYEITASTSPTGAGTVTGAGEYNYGASCTLTVTPNDGYTFVNWTKDGQVVGTSTSITFTVTGDADYVANFNTNSYEITASTNPTGAGTVTGAGEYNYGASCTLTVTPNEGYTFVNWTKDGQVVGTALSYTFTVTGDADYVANFNTNTYEITASTNPTGAGSVTGAGEYNYGASCTLTVTPNEGYTFVNWTENGSVVSNNPTYSFSVEGPRTLVANFQLNSYEIAASANPTAGGSVSGAGTYNHFETCTLVASANTGYTFVNWTENGSVVSTTPTYSFTVEGPRTLVANFQLNSYAIEATANPTAGGSVSGAGTYNHFETCTLVASANTGYTFVNWTENGDVVSNNPTYSFSVEGPRTLVANFQLNSYGIAASANPTAGGSVSGAGTYNHFETCTLVASANTGYTFVNWTENGNVVSNNPTYSFSVEGPRTLVANFQLNSYAIEATANPTAGGSVSGAGTYNHFETCTLVASANTGYTFVNWTENGSVVSNNPSYSFSVEGPRTLVANFQLNSYEIAASANPTAGGSVTGGGTYNHFETCTLVASANTGYTFVNWTENGSVVSTTPTYSFTVEGPRTLVANFQLNSYEIAASANPTAGGSVNGAGTYNHFETCTLVASANTGYTFVNWTENGSVVSTTPNYSFTVEGPRTLVANFQLNSYEIEATANPTAGGSVSGAGTYNHFETCTLVASANTGYTFVNWTENGSVVSTNPSYSFSVEGPRTLVANFQLNSYEIAASANPTAGGSVNGAGTYNHFQSCTLVASASTGYTFVNWTENGNVVSTNPTYSFTVVGPRTLVANFQLNSYQITAIANPNAGGSVSGAGTYNHFETCTLVATPSANYNFDNWTKNGVVVSTNASYSFTVTEGGTYVAHFSRVTYQITATANPTEGGSVSGAGTYSHGSYCTLTASANTGYTFYNWTKDGVVVSSNPSYSFSVTENATYVANFNLNNYQITVAADPTAGGSVSGGGAYLFGSSCTVSAMPSAGYTFTNWTKNGTVVSTEAMYTFTVTENANLIAHFSLDHYNITVSVDPEAGGTATGGGSFTYGETCTLIATPITGYAFINWTKNGTVVSSNATYSFTVTDNGDYVAHFAVARYTLTVLAEPDEGGHVHGGGTYDFGHVVTLRAIANEGYEFVNWTKNGAVVSSNANYSVVVRENAEYVANFRPYVFEIKANTYPDNTGDIEGIGYYNYGETCTLTVTPHNEYEFICWTLNGQVVSEEESFSFVVTEAREYVAHMQTDGLVEQGGITVELYPNPAKRRLTIEASEPINMLEIYNTNGALISKQSNCSDKIEINVQTYAPGTYLIRLTTDSTVEIRRFVKE